MNYKKTRAVVIERPHYANLREITLTEPREDLNIGDRVMINKCRQYGDVCAAWGGCKILLGWSK